MSEIAHASIRIIKYNAGDIFFFICDGISSNCDWRNIVERFIILGFLRKCKLQLDIFKEIFFVAVKCNWLKGYLGYHQKFSFCVWNELFFSDEYVFDQPMNNSFAQKLKHSSLFETFISLRVNLLHRISARKHDNHFPVESRFKAAHLKRCCCCWC